MLMLTSPPACLDTCNITATPIAGPSIATSCVTYRWGSKFTLQARAASLLACLVALVCGDIFTHTIFIVLLFFCYCFTPSATPTQTKLAGCAVEPKELAAPPSDMPECSAKCMFSAGPFKPEYVDKTFGDSGFSLP